MSGKTEEKKDLTRYIGAVLDKIEKEKRLTPSKIEIKLEVNLDFEGDMVEESGQKAELKFTF